MTSENSPSHDRPASPQPASPQPNRPGPGTAKEDVPAKPKGAGNPTKPDAAVPSPSALRTTRAATAWFATAAALVVLVLLIILILQNQEMVTVHYLGFTGSIQMGTALLIAAVGGASLVTTVGIVRITQLRFVARRARRREEMRQKKA